MGEYNINFSAEQQSCPYPTHLGCQALWTRRIPDPSSGGVRWLPAVSGQSWSPEWPRIRLALAAAVVVELKLAEADQLEGRLWEDRP